MAGAIGLDGFATTALALHGEASVDLVRVKAISLAAAVDQRLSAVGGR